VAGRVDTGRSAEAVAGLRAVSKRFGGTIAIEGVSFDLLSGEILALLGENGAGKSTCVKIVGGVYRPDAGTVLMDGNPSDWRSPLDAQRHGVAVMHQHPSLFGDLSVVENIFIGHMPCTRLGTIDQARMWRDAKTLLDAVGLSCDPGHPLNRLRPSEQQLVEIARALSRNARVLIMDEPTAALSQREVERLFAVVADLKVRGVAMLFVGHRMEEIYRVADRIAVLRDGRLVATEMARDLEHERAVRLMIGRPLGAFYPPRHKNPGTMALELSHLSRLGAFTDVSLAIRFGEIVGLGGLVGSGRTEIARVLFGVDRPTNGTIRLAGSPIVFDSPDAAMRAGIAYVSEDRLGQSLIMEFSILFNASLPVIDRVSFAGIVRQQKEIALLTPHFRRLRLRYRDYAQAVKTLSGGNQQKVVLSKWLATTPSVLILDEPTQGIDVQTKLEVHRMIAELSGRGLAILLISSELPELIGLCDRICVLREGLVTATFEAGDADQERIIRAATDADYAAGRDPQNGRQNGSDARAHGAAPAFVLGRFSFIQHLPARREFGLVCAIAAVMVPAAIINPRMLSASNLTAVAMDAALLMIVSAAQMLVILTRNIDLSVASIIGLSAYGSASFMHSHPQISVSAGVIVACGAGLLCGLINGVIVTVGKVPAIVVTLGTLAVFRGVDSLLTGGKQISADQVPQAWLDMTGARMAGVPAVVIIAIITLMLMHFVLRSFAMGREFYAVGSNRDGAALIGIRSRALIFSAFMLSGLLAGFDGALWASRYATIDARVATGYELTVVAAVVVGGVAIRGGAGSIVGVALGAVLLLIIQNGLTLARVDPLWLQGVYGLVILVAVGVDALVAGRIRFGLRRAS
jgi:ribose transport system ATP-binding protein/rhamnose transport system ATP-binding protein